MCELLHTSPVVQKMLVLVASLERAADVLTGFVDNDGKALGRPVGVAFDKTGALLVADDVGNTVWRVTRGAAAAASAERSD